MKITVGKLRRIIKETALLERGLSPSVFSGYLVSDPLERTSITKALEDLKQGYSAGLLHVLVAARKDKYDASKRDFDDALYNELEGIVSDSSDELLAHMGEVIQATWTKALSQGKQGQ